MSSLSFVLVQPGKRATAASKHQQRVGIHSHAQKITQQRKREKRLREQEKKSKGASAAVPTPPSLNKTVLERLAAVQDVGALVESVRPRYNNYYGYPSPPSEPDFDRPLTTYSSWTEDHKYGVNMFQHVTILDINDLNTNMSFWTEVVPAFSEIWDCVRDIVSAIASANQAIQHRDDQLFLTALDLHIRAITSLRRDLTKLPLSAQVACCLLFEAFSLLRCDFGAAGKQIDTAKMLTQRVPVRTYLEDEKLATVYDALNKMSQVPAWSLWNPSHFLKYEGLRHAEPNLYLDLEPIDPTTEPLQGLVESMQRLSRQFSGRIRRNLSEAAHVDPSCRMARDVIHELKTWKATFDVLVKAGIQDKDRDTIQQAELGWNFAYITFTSGVLASGELVYDDPKYIPYFNRINELAERRFNETADFSKHPTIKAFLQILVPSLWLVILVCRDPKIRRRAINTLKSRFYQESEFNSIIAGKLGEVIVELETRGRSIDSAWDVPLHDRIRVEGIRYNPQTEQVVLSYTMADLSDVDTPIFQENIPWKLQGDLIKFNGAIGALSQTCTLYRKVKPSSAPSGFIKPMYYKGELVRVIHVLPAT